MEKHKGSFTTVYVKDAVGGAFTTRADYVFIIGKGGKPLISLPKGKGIKLNIVDELAAKTKAKA